MGVQLLEKREQYCTYLAECTKALAVVGDSRVHLFLKISETLDEEAHALYTCMEAK